MVADPARYDRRNSRAVGPAVTGAQWLMGAAVTMSAAVVATILTVVFAATLAVAAVVMGGALAVWAVAVRFARPRLEPARAPVIEARKVGHAWVAYGWDQER